MGWKHQKKVVKSIKICQRKERHYFGRCVSYIVAYLMILSDWLTEKEQKNQSGKWQEMQEKQKAEIFGELGSPKC